MEQNSKHPGSEDRDQQEIATEEVDFQLDDIEEEIIDLVDVIEGEPSVSDDPSPSPEVTADLHEEEGKFSLDDLDLDLELEDDEPVLDTEIDSLESEETSTPETRGAYESERENIPTEGDAPSDAIASLEAEGGEEADQETDEALAELFDSYEMDVSELLGDSPDESGDVKAGAFESEEVPAVEEDISGDLFSDLELEAEASVEETGVGEEAPAVAAEVPEDLFAELDEAEASVEDIGVDEKAPAVEGEVREDLFADLEVAAEDAVEEALAIEEELPEDLFADLDETDEEEFALDDAPAPEEEVVEDDVFELEEVDEADVGEATIEPEALAPAAAEELATLVGAQVEEVVTRLVEERLPAIVERIIAQEIEKIKATME